MERFCVLDFDAAEVELERARPVMESMVSPKSVDDFLEKEFIGSLFGLAVDELHEFCESQGKQIIFSYWKSTISKVRRTSASYAELRKIRDRADRREYHLAFRGANSGASHSNGSAKWPRRKKKFAVKPAMLGMNPNELAIRRSDFAAADGERAARSWGHRYRLVGRVGSGGMGTVYVAEIQFWGGA